MEPLKLISLAKINNEIEQHETAVKYLLEYINVINQDLTKEEKYILQVSYKDIISFRRSSLRSMNLAEEKEKNPNNLALIKELKTNIEKELNDLCQKMIKIIDETLIKKSQDDESRAFYNKLKADYYRYMCENDKNNKEFKTSCKNTYKIAKIFASNLPDTSPVKLGIILNYAVFKKDILNDVSKAYELANEAFTSANNQINNNQEEDIENTESEEILKSLKENIENWEEEYKNKKDERNK